MIKRLQNPTSSLYRSDVGTDLFVGTRQEKGRQVTTFSAKMNQLDDPLTETVDESNVVEISVKIKHNGMTAIDAATLTELLHYINLYGITGITTLEDGPIELDLVDKS